MSSDTMKCVSRIPVVGTRSRSSGILFCQGSPPRISAQVYLANFSALCAITAHVTLSGPACVLSLRRTQPTGTGPRNIALVELSCWSLKVVWVPQRRLCLPLIVTV
jgi:hypothetical protein